MSCRRRDVVWLEPDVLRRTTEPPPPHRAVQAILPATARKPSIADHQAIATTKTGQQLSVTSLLPANAALSSEKITPDKNGNIPGEGQGQVADGETMNYRLRIEAPGGPADARFLDVLEGLDPGATAHVSVLIHTTTGSPFDGVAVGTTLVMFPVTKGSADDLTVQPPAGVTRLIVTGLQPTIGYKVTPSNGQLHLHSGGAQMSDAGGTLEVTL